MNGYSAGGWRQRQVRESLGVGGEREGGQEVSDAYEAYEELLSEHGPIVALIRIARRFPELPAEALEDFPEMAAMED